MKSEHRLRRIERAPIDATEVPWSPPEQEEVREIYAATLNGCLCVAVPISRGRYGWEVTKQLVLDVELSEDRLARLTLPRVATVRPDPRRPTADSHTRRLMPVLLVARGESDHARGAKHASMVTAFRGAPGDIF